MTLAFLFAMMLALSVLLSQRFKRFRLPAAFAAIAFGVVWFALGGWDEASASHVMLGASLLAVDLLPATSKDAIREFEERYLAGVSMAQPPGWASQFGDVFSVGSPYVTFPIGLMATKYLETKEQSSTFKTLEEKSFDVKVVEYDAGYEARKIDLLTNAFAYRKWTQAPGRFLLAEQRHINKNIVTLVEAGTSGTTPWDGLAFFHASHLSNPADASSTTFSNFNAGALAPTIANISAQMTLMRGVLDENGEKMGVEPSHILLPTGKFQDVVNLLSQQMINNGETNPIYGKLTPVHVPELTDADDWYLVDQTLVKAGLAPWAALQYRTPSDLGLRSWDESSDFFKNTGKLKVSSHIWHGFGLVFPHAIRRVTGA